MNRILSTLGLSLWIALLSPMVLAANLKALDVAALPGDRVELKLSFDAPPPVPHGYTTDSPARIALDLPGVASQLASKNRDLGSGNARSATVVEAKDRTRLIINLTQLAPYDSRIEGNNLLVVVGQGVKRVDIQAARAAYATPVPARAAATAGKAIRGVDFQRGTQGEGNVVIDLVGSIHCPGHTRARRQDHPRISPKPNCPSHCACAWTSRISPRPCSSSMPARAAIEPPSASSPAARSITRPIRPTTSSRSAFAR